MLTSHSHCIVAAASAFICFVLLFTSSISELHPSLNRRVAQENSSFSVEFSDSYYQHWAGKQCQGSPLGKGVLPSVVVLGVHKGGTTALFSYLAAHGNIRPGFCKETHFLDWRYSKLLHDQKTAGQWLPSVKQLRDEYRRFFRQGGKGTDVVSVEATPSYFYGRSDVAARARIVIPDARLVVTLRDPVNRTISHFVGKYDAGRSKLNCSTWFRKGSRAISSRCDGLRPRNQGLGKMTNTTDAGSKVARAWELYAECIISTSPQYEAVARSIYAPQLFRWIQYFPKEQIYVMQSESLYYNTSREMDRLMIWLEMRPHTELERKTFSHVGSNHVQSIEGLELSAFDCNRKEMQDFFQKYERDLNDILAYVR